MKKLTNLIFILSVFSVNILFTAAQEDGDVYLTEGMKGLLYVYRNSVKGPVCDDIADQYLLNLLNVGAVVCRNLGATLININTGATGPTNNFLLDDVVCNGTESNLAECNRKPWGTHNCGPGEHLYVECEVVCESHNVTVYLDPAQSKTNYTLPGCSYTGYFAEGSYIFYEHCSVYNINVLKSPIVRRLMFVSRYDVSCMLVKNAYNRETLIPSISQQKGNLQAICAPDCNMSSEIETWYTCKNNELTVYWPTDKTFSVVTKEVPDKLRDELRERLVGHETEYSNVKFQAPRDRAVEAKENIRGERIHFLLSSTCADKTLAYNSVNDLCS